MAYFPNEDGEIRTLSLTSNAYKDGLKYNKLLETSTDLLEIMYC
jgi:hypothetical protein